MFSTTEWVAPPSAPPEEVLLLEVLPVEPDEQAMTAAMEDANNGKVQLRKVGRVKRMWVALDVTGGKELREPNRPMQILLPTIRGCA